MKNQLITEIAQKMLPYLDNSQMGQLQEVLAHCLWGVHVSVATESEQLQEKETNVKNKASTNEYFEQKERIKRKNKINKLELEIEEKENEIENLKLEMQSEMVCTDYIKLKELQDKIVLIEEEIENKMLEWEKLNKEL